MMSKMVDPWPAGCGFASSARSVKTLAQGSTSSGGRRDVAFCPIKADESGRGEET